MLATLPLYFACRAYCAHIAWLEAEHRHREIVDVLDEGMAVIGADGSVTFWNDALERLVSCGRERALHTSFSAAVPALARTELPAAVEQA